MAEYYGRSAVDRTYDGQQRQQEQYSNPYAASPYSSYPMQPVASGSGSGSGTGGTGSQPSSRAPSPVGGGQQRRRDGQGQRAMEQQRQQQQQQQQYSLMRHHDDPSKEHVEMQEVQREQYGYGQQPRNADYLHPANASNAPRRQQQQQQQQQQQGSGMGSSSHNNGSYAPAPLASTSMADLTTSTTATTAASSSSRNASSKKPKKVYNTAFGEFSWSDLVKRKYWKYYAMLIVLSIVILLAVIYHDDIIRWMQPIAEKIRDITAGWTIFVGILFIISFPPLFGHEVVCLLCGLIYGLWWGFAIVALGTMLGEWGNFIVFKYWCTARSKRMEEKDVTYACICRVIREGGFKIAFMARLSAIPGHLTTPAFAACGMGFWVFSITAIVTLPKQLMAVYLGTVFGEDDEELKEQDSHIKTSKIVEWVVLGISFLVTLWAAWYIYAKMAKWRPIVLAEMAANAEGAQAVLVDGQLADDGNSTQDHDTYCSSPAKQRLVPQVRLARDTEMDDGAVQDGGRGDRRNNRLSASINRWSAGGGGDRNRNSSQMYNNRVAALASSTGMEEGSLGDLREAASPLMASSASPAGHSSAHIDHQQRGDPYDNRNLYPGYQQQAGGGNSPYSSSEEDMTMSYGYADGGAEPYHLGTTPPHGNDPHRGLSDRNNVDPASSEDVSLRWQPPQTEDLPPGASMYVQQAGPLTQAYSAEPARQPSPAPSQYSPTRYRRQLQAGASATQQPSNLYPDGERSDNQHRRDHHPNTTDISPQQTSSLPLSVQPPAPAQSYASTYLQPDVHVRDGAGSQGQGQFMPSPESAPESFQALSVQGGSRDAYPYPADPHLMPQPQPQPQAQSRSHQNRSDATAHQDGAPASRYPEMRQPRPSKPISSTNYHTGPPAASSRRYHTEADPSRESPYHTRALSPAPTYHTVMPDGHQRQQQQPQGGGRRNTANTNASRYPPSEYPPSEGPPRYETPT